MEDDIKNNYDEFKKEMRKFLRQDLPMQQKMIINSHLKSLMETIKEMNNDEFDMEIQQKVKKMQNDFMPYMVSYLFLDNEYNNSSLAS